MMLKLATTAVLLGLPIVVTVANTDLKRTVGATTTKTGGLRRGLWEEEEEEEHYYDEEMHPDTSGGAYCWEEHVGYIVTGMSDHYESDTHVKGMEGTDYHLYMYEDRKLGYEKPSYEEGSSSSSSGSSHNGYYEYHYGYEYEYSYGDDNGHMPYPPPPSDVDTTGAWCREACEKEDWCMAYEYWAYGPHGARCELWTHWTGYTDHYSGFVSYVKVSCGSSSSTGDGYGYEEEEEDEDEESSHDYGDDSNYDDDYNHDDDSGR